jgi:hypothetical protein
MIKLNKHEILRLKLMANKVLVKPSREIDELLFTDGQKIFIEHKVAPEMHAPTRGTIVNICKELNFYAMPWLTTIEAKIGDEVISSYESILYCFNDGDSSRTFVDENNDKYFLLDYSDLFIAIRDNEVIPLNGYVICEPMEESVKSTLFIPDQLKKFNSDKFGKVAYIGSVNKEYYITNGNKDIRHDLKDAADVSVGDIVIFDKNCDLPLEYDLHQSLDGRKKTFFRFNRCYIKAIVQKDFLIQYGIN